jgi:misacylated tRNA(Ala) deacylase
VTDAICYRDAYARSTEAGVTAVVDVDGSPAVTLDRTVFYPGGGGQPADTGRLVRLSADGSPEASWAVESAKKDGDDIAHRLATGDGELPRIGDRVVVAIDWERRHLLMRTHTALHTLCGVVWRDHGALVTGGNMEPGSGRMDFEFERMSGELVGSIESTVNDELAKSHEVRIRVLPRDEAFAIPDLIRTKVNLLPDTIQEIRVVEIVGLDLQADGGTHVANTSEVGRVRVTGYESKGRINKRIRIALEDAPA